MSQHSLWDVEDETTTPRVADMTIAPATTTDCREFAQRYHYTGAADNAMWRWGLWHGMVLYGIVAYNTPTRSVCESVFGPDHHQHVWHMTRLAMADRSPRNSESRLIAGSIRAIEHTHPHVWGILTYAAPSAGHIGYVYQATNALYLGEGGEPHYWTDQHGNRRGTYLSGRVGLDRGTAMGWTRSVDMPKHRYLYLLGSRTQRRHSRALLRYDVHPYPKEDTP